MSAGLRGRKGALPQHDDGGAVDEGERDGGKGGRGNWDMCSSVCSLWFSFALSGLSVSRPLLAAVRAETTWPPCPVAHASAAAAPSLCASPLFTIVPIPVPPFIRPSLTKATEGIAKRGTERVRA